MKRLIVSPFPCIPITTYTTVFTSFSEPYTPLIKHKTFTIKNFGGKRKKMATKLEMESHNESFASIISQRPQVNDLFYP